MNERLRTRMCINTVSALCVVLTAVLRYTLLFNCTTYHNSNEQLYIIFILHNTLHHTKRRIERKGNKLKIRNEDKENRMYPVVPPLRY